MSYIELQCQLNYSVIYWDKVSLIELLYSLEWLISWHLSDECAWTKQADGGSEDEHTHGIGLRTKQADAAEVWEIVSGLL